MPDALFTDKATLDGQDGKNGQRNQTQVCEKT
jgi:hypothetical protein